MDDNSRLHQASIVNEYLRSEIITPIEWSTFSPGLNPAHHMHMLDRNLSALQPRPTCVLELRTASLLCVVREHSYDGIRTKQVKEMVVVIVHPDDRYLCGGKQMTCMQNCYSRSEARMFEGK
ncbi:hypothetical protein TNCV_1940191 [Trichonephila clavipes]|nr:hypothetical protein TNCV_1940191 [Trichonephila clavipes]